MRKKGILLAVGLTLVLLATALSGCSTVNLTGQQEGITVSGEGKVSVVPDIATLNLGVEAQDTTVTTAQNQAAAAMEMIMAALTDNGVAEEDIQTQYFNIDRVTRWDDETWEEEVIGYRVTNTVSVKIRDMESIGSIIDAVVEAGGDLTRINGISFSVDDPSIYYDEAREEAMADAKARAEALAELGGVRLGKPTYITESSYQPGTIYFSGARVDEAMEAETPISPGETEITLNVQVTYDIRD
ncbi:MAG: SIMPL domain-containing protein [Dehalococcoidales bacterium]|nr:MAG: SIMPL domain-containing protein [Dehalococcoidales bacterium]